MQNKNFNNTYNIRPKKKKKGKSAGLGVFLLVIAGVWFISWKLFSGVGDFSIGLDLGDADKKRADNKEIFSEARDYPVAVMFDNHPDSQAYLTGLSDALIVYEALAEGDSTRFMGIFSGDVEIEKIGPVRSSRPYFVEIASGWSAFYLHAGGSPEALELIPTTEVIDLNEISGLGIRYFWRDDIVPRPHNLFTSSDLIALGLEDFELDELPDEKLLWQWEKKKGKSKKEGDEGYVSSVYVDFSEGVEFDVGYEHNQDKNVYMREMGGIRHRDYGSGDQFAATNIIIQRIPWEGYYPSGYGRISLDLVGDGEMLLFQNGELIQGTWEKDSRDDQTEFFDEDGDRIELVRGQTWIEVLPGSRVVSYE
jgi:hypothetical protein